jgi:D-beta-D-heptose 7-phosphate kinase/D-beta-D-heptose 1-phosphate adenosyltransferase
MLEAVYELLERAGQPRVCVVGDVMLDTYVWGEVARISPEGPIPVLRVARRDHRAGGALSLASMLAGLGAQVLAVGVVGRDAAADMLAGLLSEAGMAQDGLVRSAARPTATKTRFLGFVQSAGRAQQQLLRVDEEVTDPIGAADADAVRQAVARRLKEAELLLIQDMGKGLFEDPLLRDLIAEARRQGKPVIVDPERTHDYSPYTGATCLLPNRFEAETATGIALRDEEDCRRAARKLIAELSVESVVIKLDRDGIYYATADGQEGHVSAHVREVADVTGAGDMVAAALALARAAGADYADAVELANFAGGLEVMHSGATAIPRADVLAALRAMTDPAALKVRSRAEMPAVLKQLRRAGKRIAFTNGCFDLLHIGHVQLIEFARRQADVLVVGLNSDASARALKGPGRPINSERVRSRLLASMAAVDYVVLFDETSVLPLIQELRPEVLVKGGDYPKEGVVGYQFVESYGGQVRLAPMAKGFSTTDLIRKIAQDNGRKD